MLVRLLEEGGFRCCVRSYSYRGESDRPQKEDGGGDVEEVPEGGCVIVEACRA